MGMEIQPIIDSQMSFDESIADHVIPAEIKETLSLADVQYVSFDGLLHQGQLVIHNAVVEEVVEIFKEILATQFPIEKAIPIVAYDWDDERSMQDNNSSAFNYRLIRSTEIPSNHSYGLAIDLNTRLNPCVGRDGISTPIGATYDPSKPGTLTADSEAVRALISRGWDWGGNWPRKDWQHFAKTLPA
jgi:peptidoglycan L-alanyl-D-glutamate endopeptidase CwlK